MSDGLRWILYAEIVLIVAIVSDLLMTIRVVRKK